MKIILSAFGNKMMSKPMDVPENTTHYFYLVLTQPIQVFVDFYGAEMNSKPPFETRCRFEWMGEVTMDEGCRLYVLTDIEK